MLIGNNQGKHHMASQYNPVLLPGLPLEVRKECLSFKLHPHHTIDCSCPLPASRRDFILVFDCNNFSRIISEALSPVQWTGQSIFYVLNILPVPHDS